MISTPASGLRISERQWKAWTDEENIAKGVFSIGISHEGVVVAGLDACMTAYRILYVSTVYVDDYDTGLHYDTEEN